MIEVRDICIFDLKDESCGEKSERIPIAVLIGLDNYCSVQFSSFNNRNQGGKEEQGPLPSWCRRVFGLIDDQSPRNKI